MEAFTEHIIPGRWADVRWPNKLELKATTVLKLPIEEASAKIRTGGPIDDEEDYKLNVWAGVLPLKLCSHEEIHDQKSDSQTLVPKYISEYRRNKNES